MKKFLTFIFCATIGLRLYGQNSPAPLRLAIVSESSDTMAAADLLTTEFSKKDRVQLLERTEIEKVIREQQLSLNNLDCLKLGHLLGADGLLALQSIAEGTNIFMNAQLVAVKPGVILTDERFGRPAQDASVWSANIVGHLEPMLPKLSVLPQDAIPISVVNFHAGVRTAESAELERQILFLTVERLVREKRLFVLERKRMLALSEEKELSSTEAEPFWNGKYLLDGAIDRNGFNPDVVTISARLIPPGGNQVLIEASGSRTNYIEVVNQLAGKVLVAMKLDASPGAWNSADEADKFFKEAQWNLAWKIFPQARQSAEAAWALGKHDADCMNLRVRTFMPPPDAGVIYFPPKEKPTPEKIDDAIQAARLYKEFSQNLPADEPKPDSDWYKLGMDNLAIATRVLQQFNWSPEFYEPVADRLAELRAQARGLAELLSRAPLVHDSYFVGSRKVTSDDLNHLPGIYGLKVQGGSLWQENPEDTLALYRKLMVSPVFSYLHEQLWFRDANSSPTGLPSPPRLVAWKNADQKRLPDLWQNFVTELKESPDVFLQMEARALRLAEISFSKILGDQSFSTLAAYQAANRTAQQTYEKELSSAFTDFLDAFVTNRIYFKTNNVDVLYLNWGVDNLIERMGGNTAITLDKKESLQKQYRTEYAAKLAAIDAELGKQLAVKDAELRAENSKTEKLQAFEKQKAFLKASAPFDPGTFVQMFIFGFKDYSREQAQEIKPLLVDYKKQLSGNMARIGQMQVGQVEANIERILNPAAVAPSSPNHVVTTNDNPARPPNGNFPPGRPLWLDQPGTPPQFAPNRFPPNRKAEPEPVAEIPAPEPFVSSNVVTIKIFYPLPMDGLPGGKPETFAVTDHQLVEGKLLLDFQYTAWSDSFDRWQTYAGVALFDPASSRWQVVVLPDCLSIETGSRFLHHSTLWRGALYSSNNGKVQKFDSQKNSWDTNALPVQGNYQLYNLDGEFYVSDYNSIQQITDDARGTKLLVSIQRQPPVTSLDTQGALMNLALFTDAKNSLCAAVHNKVFRWDGADWREISAAPASFPPSVADDGVLFLTDGGNISARISCFDMRSNILETYLVPPAQKPGQHGYAPRPARNDVLLKPLWKLPTELSLPNLSAALWQSDLFLMTDHSEKKDILTEEGGTRPDGTLEVSHVVSGEKFLPKDGYDSALFCFSRGLAAAGKVLLKFDNPEGCPPMAGLGSSSQPLILQIGITKSWMLFTTKFLLCGRERWGDVPGSSEPAGFKPGIWVVPLESIMPNVAALKQAQLNAQIQQKAQAEFLAKAAQAKDQEARQAFLQKYDSNHNGVIDEDEREAAQDDPYYLKYRLGQIHAQKEANSK